MNMQELETESTDIPHRMDIKTHEENRPGSKQNWTIEKDLIKKLELELFRRWKNCKGLAVRADRQELQESLSTVNQLATQIQKLQERANSSNDSLRQQAALDYPTLPVIL